MGDHAVCEVVVRGRCSNPKLKPIDVRSILNGIFMHVQGDFVDSGRHNYLFFVILVLASGAHEAVLL
jgi:hypothetical protein